MSHQYATPQSDAGFFQPKSLIDLNFQPLHETEAPVDDERHLVLTHREAQAGSPLDFAACGEEDPGSGLEFLVTEDGRPA